MIDEKRVFIALPFSEGFKKEFKEAIFDLKEKCPEFRWLPEENWHLTILPPHYWSENEIEIVSNALKTNLKSKIFNLEADRIVLGPPSPHQRFIGGGLGQERAAYVKTSASQSKRMVWLLFKDSQEFFNLKTQVAKIIESVGIALDKPYQKEIIHLTLARFKNQARGFQEKSLNNMVQAEKVELWRVFLDSSGAVYQSLASFKLL